MRIKRLTAAILAIFFVLLINNNSVSAQEGESVPISVRAVLPENQVSGQSYFDIELESGETQDLEVLVFNDSDEEITIEVTANLAASNTNGVVTYDGSITEFSEALPYEFSDIVEVQDETVTVPANDEATVIVTVTAPDESFDDKIISGLHFKHVKDSSQTTEAVGIGNEFAYVIGLNITEKGNDVLSEPQIDLEIVVMEEFYGRPNLLATFENSSSAHLSQLRIEANVFPAGKDEAVQTAVDERYSIAPYNRVIFPMLLDEGYLEAGDYVFEVHAENDTFDETFEMEFTITEDEE